MRITTKTGRKAAALTVASLTVAAVSGLALVPATAATAAPAAGETVTVTLRVRPEEPRGFVDSFGTSILGGNGLEGPSFCDNLDAGPVTTRTITVKVGDRVSIMPTAGCYLITNTSLRYTVTADTKVIDVPLFAVH